MSNVNDKKMKAASDPADAPTSAAAKAEPEAKPARKKVARPMWQYVGALVLSIAAIAVAAQSYNRAVHANESWGGPGVAEANARPKVNIDEQIKKIKADKNMPEAAKKRAIAGLEFGRAMEAAHGR
jgi:hypothetical protein